MNPKRVTLFAGHYGSGKTNIALNYARWLKRQGIPVTIADLDIVNPYFRTKDSEEILGKAGVRVLSQQFANSNVDLPALPQEMYSITDDKAYHAVADIGGDEAHVGEEAVQRAGLDEVHRGDPDDRGDDQTGHARQLHAGVHRKEHLKRGKARGAAQHARLEDAPQHVEDGVEHEKLQAHRGQP